MLANQVNASRRAVNFRGMRNLGVKFQCRMRFSLHLVRLRHSQTLANHRIAVNQGESCMDSNQRAISVMNEKELRSQLTPNFPMVPEWIRHAPHPPAMFFADRVNLGSTRLSRLRENSIRIRHRQNHTNRTTLERFGAGVMVLRRLLAYPELR